MDTKYPTDEELKPKIEKDQNIDPVFFRKMAKVWASKYAPTKDANEAVNKFAEFVDTTLAMGNDYEGQN